jgi:hypothetical protein
MKSIRAGDAERRLQFAFFNVPGRAAILLPATFRRRSSIEAPAARQRPNFGRYDPLTEGETWSYPRASVRLALKHPAGSVTTPEKPPKCGRVFFPPPWSKASGQTIATDPTSPVDAWSDAAFFLLSLQHNVNPMVTMMWGLDTAKDKEADR